MRRTLLTRQGPQQEPPTATLDAALQATEMCWLDIDSPTANEIDRLGALLHLHPLAIEDSKEFGQRPKVSIYDGFAMMVGFGTGDGDALVEVHCYYSTDYIVTLHNGQIECLTSLLRSKSFRSALDGDPVVVLYRLADALYGSVDPVIDRLDDQLTDVEAEVLGAPRQAQLEKLAAIKQRAVDLKRAVAQAREMLGPGGRPAIEDLPGMTENGLRYARDLSQTVTQIASDVDAVEQHAASVLNLHLTLTSNRQNDVMRQLTIIATVFLPLTFLVGFFGQNFSTLVDLESGWVSFVVFGLLLEGGSVLALLFVLRSRGWSRVRVGSTPQARR